MVNLGIEQREGYSKNEDFYRKFGQTFGIDYCPVYSVVGSIISQEIIKIAESMLNFYIKINLSLESTGCFTTACKGLLQSIS